MRTTIIGIATIVAVGWAGIPADAQSWRPPAESQRCPSKWGAGDERGSGDSGETAGIGVPLVAEVRHSADPLRLLSGDIAPNHEPGNGGRTRAHVDAINE